MNDSIDPTKPIDATRNDPTPEQRVGDSRFLFVVIAAGVALVVILIAAVILINGKKQKIVPKVDTAHPTSQVVMYQPSVA